ncbi:hypothetical protein SCP_0507500 [Sparassis crispa]|uniref:Reverse transcriptase RNase H-like domain-containing protein n=1 Tax=Sparassis crispa TaxID=139825 RepID=A0A401GPL1_9APHY|nr:hypothetical protein SCP_0507500 [Sparassis crispa]GBE83694.1 hypothetical protein SCP_0507500 [Sparassis crispa]
MSVERVHHMAIYSDNTNTVALFDTLRALPAYNSIAKSAVDVLIRDDMQLRVTHILGKDNVIADVLSRKQFTLIMELIPGIQFSPFTPSQDALGAATR